jgi:hypothetical protein
MDFLPELAAFEALERQNVDQKEHLLWMALNMQRHFLGQNYVIGKAWPGDMAASRPRIDSSPRRNTTDR